ncbi:hypothetical protein [Adhaeretor mobilis]|uniref:Uncharacterized protein n=1 Tax=Adhaeretor mobilis TaxID=1930276 RepID=A0A517N095_9BACT|nr:hypothetical protein [Adhaeretor mobilis]QDT00560.1 hypothetical protein HG15A2_38980 [Adhaeretor mobilis]
MARIFTTLSTLSLGLVAAALVLGLGIGDLYTSPPESSDLRLRSIHLLTGVAAALAVVLVESIVVTYFIGTSRWCKEVTETYALDTQSLRKSIQLKRKTFPLCLVGMFTVVGVAALGARSDPGNAMENTADWANVHLVAALAGICLIGWTYYRAWLNISANQTVIESLVDQVQKIRKERGLETADDDA